MERVAAARGLRRPTRADPRGRGRPSHELSQTGQECHEATLAGGPEPTRPGRFLTLGHGPGHARAPRLSTSHNAGPYARPMSSTAHGTGSAPPPHPRSRTSRPRRPGPGGRRPGAGGRPCWRPAAARRRSAGCATAPGCSSAAAMRRLDDDLEWYRALPAEDRSWVGLVAQAGITAFVTWFAEPTRPPHGVGDIFAAAPPELTRSISLQHTLQLVRVVVDVVETHSDRLAAPGRRARGARGRAALLARGRVLGGRGLRPRGRGARCVGRPARGARRRRARAGRRRRRAALARRRARLERSRIDAGHGRDDDLRARRRPRRRAAPRHPPGRRRRARRASRATASSCSSAARATCAPPPSPCCPGSVPVPW